jgi:ElaB/YqjD/DUF883 family membrane-anchored ribosome-binding protein
MGEYAAFNLRKCDLRHLAAFNEKLSEYHQVIEQGFSDVGKRRHELVDELKAVSEKLETRFRNGFDIATQPLRALKTKKRLRTSKRKRLLSDKTSNSRGGTTTALTSGDDKSGDSPIYG